MNYSDTLIPRLFQVLLCCVTAIVPHHPVHADTSQGIDRGLNWDYCNPDGPAHDLTMPSAPLPIDKPQLEADEAAFDQQAGRGVMEGSVRLWQPERYAEADRVIYHQSTATADLFGNLFVEQSGLRLTADTGHLELDENRGWLTEAEFRLTERNARGSAARAEMLNEDLSRYDQVIYTTCPPDRRDWYFKASELDIDLADGWGSAKHARLHLGPVPIFYAPYFTFPVDDRRMTGFLVPAIGSSNRLGTELETPYYFNLAPNYDATLSPRWMSKRGMMLGGEFRYLGEHQQAVVSGEILPDDKVESKKRSNERRAFRFTHGSRLAPGLTTRIDTSAVSDDDYLDDFGTGLAITSTRHLERVGEVVYRQGALQLTGRVQSFQTVDESLNPRNHPYRRLPQLLANYTDLFADETLDFSLLTEYTDFRHDTLINGERFTFKPAISLPMRRSWGHLIPRISLNYATYRLDEDDSPTDPSPDYFVPAFSLDSGLIFERETSWFGDAAYQTLEPRLYYLNASFDDQSDIPDFDTADLNLTFNNLFKENRFSGSDRFGDANQISLGITTRWLAAENGQERLRASIGQIYYQQDREVQLTGAVEDNPSSSVVAEAAARIGRYWSSTLTIRRDPHVEEKNIDRGRLGIHYRTPKQHLINLDYNFARDTIEDLDLSFNWPFSHKFTLSGKWKYSYLYERNVNRILGLEYGGGCCWKLRALYQRYIADEDIAEQDEDTRFLLQLELTGLGALGSTVDETFEENIYGYRADQ
ncbi:MAG: LPS-assembly protein LptD [Candidatus Thiodiazotropha sp. (ex Monitilora ramsayi)]|nr:LPS-assembly protein LptD [Candidatus Thiodiazotropha sp. (ex Monitilora ramsayi)]